jgi:hypothetical protein
MNLPFEIHVTVNGESGVDVSDFKQHCCFIGVKPIVLELQNKLGVNVMSDFMTSSTINCTEEDAFSEMKRISNALSEFGYSVVREKLESAYYHPKAPSIKNSINQMPDGCYFECHFNVVSSNEMMPILSSIANNTNCHLSKNVFKLYSDGSFTVMMTHRSYDQVYEQFESSVHEITSMLTSCGFEVEKEIVEFCVWDSKDNHDLVWINS